MGQESLLQLSKSSMKSRKSKGKILACYDSQRSMRDEGKEERPEASVNNANHRGGLLISGVCRRI